MKNPVRVTITGAVGNIGYALAFRIAAGDMLGTNQPIILQLLEITPALSGLQGVAMELYDCAFPLLQQVIPTDNPDVAFKDCDYALLVSSRPRTSGMERKDLLTANSNIFTTQGKAINRHANRDVKVLVVGNPANTNCLITQINAPDIHPKQFSAMTRLDHNRAIYQLAEKVGAHSSDIKRMIIWGNHSSTQYPDISYATAKDKPTRELIEQKWYTDIFIPTIQQRGSAVIQTRGASSAASAASAAIDHMRNWALGTPEEDWVSMAVLSDGSYGIEPGLVYSYPVICTNGEYSIVQGLTIDEFSHIKMEISRKELCEERDIIQHLLS